MLDVDQGKSIVHKLFFLWSSVFLMIHRSTIWDFSAKFRSLDLQKMFLSNFVICIFKQNICPFQWDSKTSSANITVFITSRPGTEKKNKPWENIGVWGSPSESVGNSTQCIYTYIYVRLFIYSLVYLFIGLFIYLFIYLYLFMCLIIHLFYMCIYIYIYVYIYIYISYIYIYKLTPAISNQLAVCTSRPLFWCFNHQLFIVEPLILIARFSFSGYIWPNRWICLVNIPIWSVFKTFCHSIILVG